MPQALVLSVLACYGGLSCKRAAPGELSTTHAPTSWKSALRRGKTCSAKVKVCQYEKIVSM